jgi:hypothetical protein
MIYLADCGAGFYLFLSFQLTWLLLLTPYFIILGDRGRDGAVLLQVF